MAEALINDTTHLTAHLGDIAVRAPLKAQRPSLRNTWAPRLNVGLKKYGWVALVGIGLVGYYLVSRANTRKE